MLIDHLLCYFLRAAGEEAISSAPIFLLDVV